MALPQAALHEISAMQDHVMVLGRKSAGERVTSLLNTFTQRNREPLGANPQIELPTCRSDIDDSLGLTTETVSRASTALRTTSVIAPDGAPTIMVLDATALQDMSQGSA